MPRPYIAGATLVLLGLAFGLGWWAGHEPVPPSRIRGGTGSAPVDASVVALREALLDSDVLERTAKLGRLLQGLGPDALDEVRAAYDGVFLDQGDIDLVLLAEWWARFDPQAAFDWAHEEWRAEHPGVVRTVLRAWAREDPEAALAAASTAGQQSLRNSYRQAVIAGWEESGRSGLLEFVEQLPPGGERQRAIATLARRMVLRHGVEESFRWAESVPDGEGEFKLNVFRRVGSAAAEVEPERAAAWAERHEAGDFGNGLPRRVAVRWAKRDGAAAMAWLATLPAGRNRDDGVREGYRSWLRHDKEAAKAWMRSTELAEWNEPALSLFAMMVAQENPQEGVEWASRIRDDARRDGTIVLLGRIWLRQDAEAARAWMDGANLDPDTKRRMFEFPGAPPQLPDAASGDPEDD